MIDKDTLNLSNIYQKTLNETKNRKFPLLKEIFGGFMKGTELAKQGKSPFTKDVWVNKEKTKTKEGNIGFKNEPEVGQIIVSSSDYKIKAVVESPINKKTGQYNIRLIGATPNDPSPYSYFVTDLHPDGIITTLEKLQKSNRRDRIVSQSDRLTVGFNTQYPAWQDYKTVLKNF